MNTTVVSFNTTVRQMTEMSQQKTGCKYYHLLGMPFAKLALHCICVFLVHAINNVSSLCT